MDDIASLVGAARDARRSAYAPYSGFAVGAAIQTADGDRYRGCNVEVASFSEALHAEQLAVWRAVVAGERRFAGLAVASATGAPPCGACRQVLSEFCDPDHVVLVVDVAEDTVVEHTLGTLYPDPFGPEHLGGREREP